MVLNIEVGQNSWLRLFGKRLDVGGAELGCNAVVGEEFGKSMAGARVLETTNVGVSR